MQEPIDAEAETSFAHLATMAKAHFAGKRSVVDIMEALRGAPQDSTPEATLAADALDAMTRCATSSLLCDTQHATRAIASSRAQSGLQLCPVPLQGEPDVAGHCVRGPAQGRRLIARRGPAAGVPHRGAPYVACDGLSRGRALPPRGPGPRAAVGGGERGGGGRGGGNCAIFRGVRARGGARAAARVGSGAACGRRDEQAVARSSRACVQWEGVRTGKRQVSRTECEGHFSRHATSVVLWRAVTRGFAVARPQSGPRVLPYSTEPAKACALRSTRAVRWRAQPLRWQP